MYMYVCMHGYIVHVVAMCSVYFKNITCSVSVVLSTNSYHTW